MPRKKKAENASSIHILKRLGRGWFANVYHAQFNKKEFALKEYTDNEASTLLEREVELLTKCKHPNIIAMLNEIPVDENQLALEFMELGDLANYLQNNLNITQLFGDFMALDIANGLDHLHQIGWLYGDLKPANVLLSALQGPRIIAKLCDFNQSVKLSSTTFENTEAVNTAKYTPIFQAPECRSYPYQACRASDIYAYGGTLASIFFGNRDGMLTALTVRYSSDESEPPTFVHHSEMSDIIKSHRGNLSPSIAALIARCWRDDPAKRPTASAISHVINNNMGYEHPHENSTFRV